MKGFKKMRVNLLIYIGEEFETGQSPRDVEKFAHLKC